MSYSSGRNPTCGRNAVDLRAPDDGVHRRAAALLEAEASKALTPVQALARAVFVALDAFAPPHADIEHDGEHRRRVGLAAAYIAAGVPPHEARARLAAAVRLGERSRPVLALRLEMERIFGAEVA